MEVKDIGFKISSSRVKSFLAILISKNGIRQFEDIKI